MLILGKVIFAEVSDSSFKECRNTIFNGFD
jgi:hypothetical protein